MKFWMILALEDKIAGCLDYSTSSIVVKNKNFSNEEIDYALSLVSRWFRIYGNIRPRKIINSSVNETKVLTFYI